MLHYKKSIIRNILIFLSLVVLIGCQQAPPIVNVYVPEPTESEPAKTTALLVTSVYFDFDKWKITPQASLTLNNLATAMLSDQLAGQTFLIQGHTDIVGRLGYNLALSQFRAAAVGDYLIRQGVDSDYLLYEGFGPLQLKDPINPRSGVNRRVEIFTFVK